MNFYIVNCAGCAHCMVIVSAADEAGAIAAAGNAIQNGFPAQGEAIPTTAILLTGTPLFLTGKMGFIA